jgi:hypothetical protein
VFASATEGIHKARCFLHSMLFHAVRLQERSVALHSDSSAWALVWRVACSFRPSRW